jgi:GalNAc-alpha-(1->4)-GalNAc-alpha-(1->3)-diNAcBac-PP-undecaprenol alpha-1,4-N-acetyl-D-galactosaminyltransferase
MTSRGREAAPHAFLFISTMGVGGAERAMSELGNWLTSQKWKVTLATLTDGEQPDRYPICKEVQRLHLGNPTPSESLLGKLAGNIDRVRSLRAAIKEERPTVIVSFMESNNVLALIASCLLKLPVVVVERTDPSQNLHEVGLFWRLARRHLYRNARFVVAQTHNAANWLMKECHCAVQVLPNALRYLPEPQQTRERWVVTAGRLEPVKGHDIVLAAFAMVASDLHDWTLIVAGEGRLLEDLQNQAKDLGIAKRVVWLGHRHDLECILEKASIVALASRFEGFPNVLLEALAMGAAVVATDCRSGPSELINPGKNGLLVAVNDTDGIAAAIKRLALDTELRAHFGRHAMELRSLYSQPIVLAQWANLLEQASIKR